MSGHANINVGDWVRINVDQHGAPVGSIVKVIDKNDLAIFYNWNGFLTFAANRRNVTLVPHGLRLPVTSRELVPFLERVGRPNDGLLALITLLVNKRLITFDELLSAVASHGGDGR